MSHLTHQPKDHPNIHVAYGLDPIGGTGYWCDVFDSEESEDYPIVSLYTAGPVCNATKKQLVAELEKWGVDQIYRTAILANDDPGDMR